MSKKLNESTNHIIHPNLLIRMSLLEYPLGQPENEKYPAQKRKIDNKTSLIFTIVVSIKYGMIQNN